MSEINPEQCIGNPNNAAVVKSEGYEVVFENGQKGIKCLKCHLISFNEHDIKHKYCGNCHVFHDLFRSINGGKNK